MIPSHYNILKDKIFLFHKEKISKLNLEVLRISHTYSNGINIRIYKTSKRHIQLIITKEIYLIRQFIHVRPYTKNEY